MTAGFIHQSLRTRVIARPGAVAELGTELSKLGCRRPVLLASQRTSSGALYAQVRDILRDVAFAQVNGIPAHSSVETVQRIARLAREHRADAFVCVGGGSVSDSAKAAALLLAEGEPLARHASRFEPPATVHTPDLHQPKLPILSIPMTASGAEVTPSLGIRTADGTKLLFWDAQLASRVVFLDPQANLEMPARTMLATGMNGLAHCIEGLYSKGRSPIASVLALDGLARFDRALRAVAHAPDAVQARAELLLAAHVSGMVLASARSCLHHAICHILGASFGVGHGEVNSVILPHAVAFNASHADDELGAAARQLGLDGGSAALVSRLHELQHATGVPTRLRDLGIPADALPDVARKVLHERGLAYNPRLVRHASEIEAILTAAW